MYGDDGKLEYEYRLVCGQSYYGRDCDIICKPRHDNFGHYTCGPGGEKICLEGWEKDNQNSARDDYCLKRKCYPHCHLENRDQVILSARETLEDDRTDLNIISCPPLSGEL